MLGLLIIFSCKPKYLTPPLSIGEGNNANAMVITGYGYSGATFYFNFAKDTGFYDTTQHQTSLYAVEDTDSLHLQVRIHFSGEATFLGQDTLPGLYNVSDTILFTNKNSLKTTTYGFVAFRNYLTITGYDNAGGHIEGVFSGAFVNTLPPLDTLRVSNGRFAVTRVPDHYK